MMLGRMADNLFWIARYMERAENLARLLESTYHASLMPVGRDQNQATAWEGLIDYFPDKEDYEARYGKLSSGTVIAYMALDTNNPSSIISCINQTRENARASRHMLTTEVWETVNQTYHEVKGLTYPKLMDLGYAEFFEWVKERSHLFRGVAFGTIRRGDAFLFARLGTFTERADNTGRQVWLRAKEAAKLKGDNPGDRTVDYYKWGGLLRSLSAFKAYREIYGSGIEPKNVAELLVLRADMPRSLHGCMNEILPVLDDLNPKAECMRVAGKMHAKLHYGRIDEVQKVGLEKFVDRFIVENNGLGNQIRKDFMMVA